MEAESARAFWKSFGSGGGKQVTGTVLSDVQSAFNNASRVLLAKRTKQLGVEADPIRWTVSFMTDRRVKNWSWMGGRGSTQRGGRHIWRGGTEVRRGERAVLCGRYLLVGAREDGGESGREAAEGIRGSV